MGAHGAEEVMSVTSADIGTQGVRNTICRAAGELNGSGGGGEEREKKGKVVNNMQAD